MQKDRNVSEKTKEAQDMKDTLKNTVTVLGIALMLGISFYGWMAYETQFKITYIGTEASPEGGGQVIFQMLGEPSHSSESADSVTGGRAIVKQGDVEIKTVPFSVPNGGAPLSEENWEVEFYQERVEILIKGASGEEAEHIVVYLQ